MDTNQFITDEGVIYEIDDCNTRGMNIRVIVHYPADLEGLNPNGYKVRKNFATFGDLFMSLQWVKATPYKIISLGKIAD